MLKYNLFNHIKRKGLNVIRILREMRLRKPSRVCRVPQSFELLYTSHFLKDQRKHKNDGVKAGHNMVYFLCRLYLIHKLSKGKNSEV